MSEILLLMALLFAVYLFLPKAWFSKHFSEHKPKAVGQPGEKTLLIPEDSVLRRHYITQLRSEIELDLFPRPTDSTLQRHYDTLVAVELENRLTALAA